MSPSAVPKFSKDRLRAARSRAGFTREKLAVDAQVPYGSLLRYEHGTTLDPPINAVARLALALGVTIDSLIESS
jgi:transcriptional regulator with XRE-family HTH domain